MTLSDAPTAILAALAGLMLGVIFFGGLWWTVRRALTSPQPALLVMASMMGRTAIVVVGFYFASGGQWQRLLLCVAGFIVARVVVIRLLPRVEAAPQAPLIKAPHHAP